MRKLLINSAEAIGKIVEKIEYSTGYDAEAILFTDGSALVKKFHYNDGIIEYVTIYSVNTHYKAPDIDIVYLLHGVNVLTDEEYREYVLKANEAVKRLHEEQEKRQLKMLMDKYGPNFQQVSGEAAG